MSEMKALPYPKGELRSAESEQRQISFAEYARRYGMDANVCPYCGATHITGECQFAKAQSRGEL